MRKTLLIATILLAAVNASFSQSDVAEMPPGLQAVRARLMSAAQQACSDRAVQPCELLSFTSTPLMGNINFYYMVLQVGPGTYDRIGIAHLVKEQHPGKALDGGAAAFFIPGAVHTFASDFINASTLPDNPGIAPWLADRGIDVWGVDLRYTFVPSTVTDFTFMADWDLAKMTNDVLLATRFARLARRMTGQHFGTLHLVGHSLGGGLVYSVANTEATLAEQNRDIGDMIPIETIYKLPPTDTTAKTYACSLEAAYRNGAFYLDDRLQKTIGEAGRANPDGISAYGMTNRELALYVACANFVLPAFPYHDAACLLDSRGVPTAGRFSPSSLIIDYLADGVPFHPSAVMADYYGLACGGSDLPYDDHLADIRIPSLYIGAAGGFGLSGTYTNSLLGSPEKATIFIRMLSPGLAVADFGHAEPFIANDAATLVWQPVLEWIRGHENN